MCRPTWYPSLWRHGRFPTHHLSAGTSPSCPFFLPVARGRHWQLLLAPVLPQHASIGLSPNLSGQHAETVASPVCTLWVPSTWAAQGPRGASGMRCVAAPGSGRCTLKVYISHTCPSLFEIALSPFTFALQTCNVPLSPTGPNPNTHFPFPPTFIPLAPFLS